MKAGDKVVLVDDNWDAFAKERGSLPVKGVVYVVRETFDCPATKKPSIRLFGLTRNFSHYWGMEYGLFAWRFRLVSEFGHPPIKVERPQPATA